MTLFAEMLRKQTAELILMEDSAVVMQLSSFLDLLMEVVVVSLGVVVE